MFKYIRKKIGYLALKDKNNSQSNISSKADNDAPVLPDLQSNLKTIQGILCSSDVIIHQFTFGRDRKFRGALIYIDSMVNKDEIHKSILKPLMYDSLMLSDNKNLDFSDMATIQRDLISISDNIRTTLLNDVVDSVLTGAAILLVNSSKEALIINSRKWESRGIEEPQTESVVRGPREGFTENINVGLALIRRKIKDPDLCIENFKIGDRSKTQVSIVYLKNVANQKLIDEISIRLKRIKIDAILESGYIEQFIEDAPYSIFSTVSNSEKPDKVAAKILEGCAAILVDGTPFALVAPMLFLSGFQSSEDYYSRPFFTSFIRTIRFLSFIISILAPATYVALTVFHQELIPTQLLISIAAGREKVPFPAVLEAFLMLIIFDILREAGLRLPRPIGQTVSIVGAIVLGQAAVEAGLISPIMVIVVATTAIASFVVPPQADAGTILRYLYLILAGVGGGFGIIMGLLITLLHLSSLRSFGTPYLWPIAPVNFSSLKDVFIRMPLWKLLTRPKAIIWSDDASYRQSPDLRPSPEQKKR
ncbi:MAG: gerBA2 [Eubacterium sp.]|nr:gerBA2 [Eubacterium sp.]